MTDALLGPWIRRYLLEYLVGERNLARNTQRSYRDTLALLLPFAACRAGQPIDRLEVEALSADHVRCFLQELEEKRKCSVATRNQRLAAVHSLAHFVARHSPEHIRGCGEIRAVPFKKAARPLVTYLEKSEIDAVLSAPDTGSSQGLRDHAGLLFLYNTGARADEAAHVLIGDLRLGATPSRDPSSVVLRGKGNKLRQCPLWTRTVAELTAVVTKRGVEEHVFLNRRGKPLTRFGVYALVQRHAAKAAKGLPSLDRKRVGPHIIRHTTAMHLLRSGVDINTIRAWLGHVSLSTTNIYAEADLEMKANALAKVEIEGTAPKAPWREDGSLMAFLRDL